MSQQAVGPKNSHALTGVVVGALVVIVAAVAAFSKKDTAPSEVAIDATPSAQQSTTPSSTQSSIAVTATPSPSSASVYKNGSYTSTGAYTSPGGQQQIQVSVTLQNDKVTAASVVSKASDDESEEYQGKFASGFKALVIGKNIDDISLSRVSGSSLTSHGFNAALTTIKAQAKS
jgi:uncharacterized protein with FMN-binding domain